MMSVRLLQTFSVYQKSYVRGSYTHSGSFRKRYKSSTVLTQPLLANTTEHCRNPGRLHSYVQLCPVSLQGVSSSRSHAGTGSDSDVRYPTLHKPGSKPTPTAAAAADPFSPEVQYPGIYKPNKKTDAAKVRRRSGITSMTESLWHPCLTATEVQRQADPAGLPSLLVETDDNAYAAGHSAAQPLF